MATQSLKWNGEAVLKMAREATIAGVNMTMKECVVHATENHPWKNHTASLEGSLDVHVPARAIDGGVEGKWGSADIDYALALELGATINHPGGTAFYIDERGKAVFVSNKKAFAEGLPRTKPHTIILPAHPYLRPAADACYPNLPANIKKAMNARMGNKG